MLDVLLDARLRRPEEDEARQLLERRDVLDVMAADLEALGTVGETENKQVLFLAMVSRLLQRPVNVVVKGPSSSGKSYLVRSVGELFPDEAILALSAMTPRALYYMREEELCHRVLFVDEYMAHAGRDHALRLMQSEGRLIMAMTQQTGGELGTRTRTVKGPIAFITTTTRSNIFDENETRAFALQTDCSQAQTRRIHDAQRRARSFDRPTPHYGMGVWQSAMGLLESRQVVIPFADHIHLASTGQARDRRDLGRILSLVEASALLHQRQRDEMDHRGQPWLVADLEDYRTAYRLAGAFLAPPPAPEAPVEALVAACRSVGEEAASHYQLMDLLGWSRPTVIKYCQQAVAAGRLRLVEGKLGGQKQYRVAEEAAAGMLTSPDEVGARYDAALERKKT
jgi:hypothetical protein